MKRNTPSETQYSSSPRRSGIFSNGFSAKGFLTWFVIILSPFISVFVYSGTAKAGLISFVSSLIGGEEASAKISPRNAVSLQTMNLLAAATNADPNPEKSGDSVPVLGGETLVADLMSSGADTEGSSQISIYTVRDGDSISGVAKMFNVSVNTILWANNLTSKSLLQPGQTLIILPVTGVSYTVQKNDTVASIAKKYHADPEDIYNYNDLTDSFKLKIGDKLIIPDAEMTIVTSDTKGKKSGVISAPVIGNGKGLPSYPGFFSCPVSGGTITQKLHGKNAVDLAAPVGTTVKAAAAGTVIISISNNAYNGGYGNYIVISHGNGTQTLYAHFLRNTVKAGTVVSKGQTIGYIGMTGLTTGPHTHFEIRGAQNPFSSSACI